MSKSLCSLCRNTTNPEHVVYPCCCDLLVCFTCYRNNVGTIIKSTCRGCGKSPADARSARTMLKQMTVRRVAEAAAIRIDPGRALVAERSESLRQILESLEAIKDGMRDPEKLRAAIAQHKEIKEAFDQSGPTHKPKREYEILNDDKIFDADEIVVSDGWLDSGESAIDLDSS